LVAALDEDDGALRATAAQALGELGAQSARDHLLKTLQVDEDMQSRRAAAYALGLIGDTSAVPDLIAVLCDPAQPPALRGMVAEALADLGDTSAASGLHDVLFEPSAEVRFWAAYALGRLGTSDVVAALKRLSSDGAEVPGYGTVAEESARAISLILDREERQG
jgi:HEAT repeat protein